MKQNPMIGKAVTLNADLLDLRGNAHPLAGQTVIILNKVRKAYQADDNKGGMAIFHDGDFTTTPAAEGNGYIHVAGISTQLANVPPGELRESPFNPRKRFDEDSLAELTETVKAVGIMQPLLVRRVQVMVDGVTIDWLEIVFGHRRNRAALRAGLLEVPVMIRDLTDAQSARLQAIENLQREDLDPIEEAQGYADHCKNHGMNKQELADYIGVSRTTVYNQLKLLELGPEGRDLVQRGALGTELAMQVARAGSPEVQAPVLKKIFYGADLATATKETKAMSLRQGMALLESIEKPKAAGVPKVGKAPATQQPPLTKTRGYIALREFIRQMRENGTAIDDEGEDTDALEELADSIEAIKV
ncbi:MAG: ParB/RepB/Spo0J family partition protein [Pseudomonadota bacterium]